MMRWMMLLEYAGDGFEGWQSQPHGRTVQDALEAAIAAIAGEPVAVHCAGRTDTGVHALAQVVHFDTTAVRPASAWVRGVNAHLPASIRVWHAQPVPPTFHARFCAQARRYQYVLYNAPVAPAVWHGKVGWFHVPLALKPMQEAAQKLLGRHDFSAFRAASCQAKNPVRTLHAAQVRQHGAFFLFDFEADGFLHHMVRNLVGTLVYIGKGYAEPDWVGHLLACRDRRHAAPTFSPSGLYFCGAVYDAHWGLPQEGRLFRGLPWFGEHEDNALTNAAEARLDEVTKGNPTK